MQAVRRPYELGAKHAQVLCEIFAMRRIKVLAVQLDSRHMAGIPEADYKQLTPVMTAATSKRATQPDAVVWYSAHMSNIGVAQARKDVEFLEKHKFKLCVYVLRNGCSFSQQARAHCKQSSCRVQIFDLHEVAFNRLKHKWVSAHVKLTASQARDFKRKHKIHKDSKLPQLLESDIICRMLDYMAGDLVLVLERIQQCGVVPSLCIVR